jgi:hypothetical protein
MEECDIDNSVYPFGPTTDTSVAALTLGTSIKLESDYSTVKMPILWAAFNINASRCDLSSTPSQLSAIRNIPAADTKPRLEIQTCVQRLIQTSQFKNCSKTVKGYALLPHLPLYVYLATSMKQGPHWTPSNHWVTKLPARYGNKIFITVLPKTH